MYCGCGCGKITEIALRSDSYKGWIKGLPKKYIYLHKLPPSFKGKTRSFKDRLNKSIAAKKRVKDGTHNFYKGGLSSKWINMINSFEYKTWKRDILKRDNWTCVICGNKKGIQTDHIKPKARFPELIFDLNNGRTLCEKCHLKTDTWGGRTTFYGK